MKTKLMRKEIPTIYPGVFIAGYTEEDRKSTLDECKVIVHDIEDLCTHKSNNGWMLKIPFPGKVRENFHIRTEDNYLSIYIVKDIWQKGNLKNHEAVKVELPQSADKPFISASLKNGILSIFVPICDDPLENDNNNIMVY